MNKLSLYLKERQNVDSIETDYGFASYKISGEECYIIDIYIEKQFRQIGMASKLADQVRDIAKEQGCKYLTGSVCPAAFGADDSIRVLQGYGMKIYQAKENLIIFKKDIEE